MGAPATAIIAAEAEPAIRTQTVTRVRVCQLMLSDYRSYARASLAFDGRPVTLSGANGAGKTNLIEALSMLGPGRGLRGARLDELPRRDGAGGWAVSALLSDRDEETRIGAGVEACAADRRACRIEGRSAGPGELSAYVRFLWLTPALDRLFVEGASERRRFLDRMTLAHDPAHAEVSTAYEKAMRQRQRLLEDATRDDAWLRVLEAQMAEAGVAIAAGRRDMAARLAEGASGGDGGPFPDADIALEGALEAALEDRPAADVEDAFAAELRNARRRDAEAGRALSGPHRSDLSVTHRAKAQPARLCSTGEQKALLIGLVLANARALARQPGGAPLILLLDEIAAHLDADRRAALYDILSGLGFQTFMTGTDPELFAAWGDRAEHFAVSDGAVHPLRL